MFKKMVLMSAPARGGVGDVGVVVVVSGCDGRGGRRSVSRCQLVCRCYQLQQHPSPPLIHKEKQIKQGLKVYVQIKCSYSDIEQTNLSE